MLLTTPIGCEDGERVQRTANLIGRSLVTALNALHIAGLLKADSEIKDIGLILSLYLAWSSDFADFGLDDFEWRKEAVAYARTAGIDLGAVGCFGVEEQVGTLEDEYGAIGPLQGAAKADRWAWKKNVSYRVLENAVYH